MVLWGLPWCPYRLLTQSGTGSSGHGEQDVHGLWAWLSHRLVVGLVPSHGRPGHLGTYWKVASHLYKC